jgi:glucose-6-phosphate 1-dehydrogenase
VIPNLVLLGATGDLAGRFLFPALAVLRSSGRLPDDFVVVGAARQRLDEDAFRAHVSGRLAAYAGGLPGEDRDALVRSVRYEQADVAAAQDISTVLGLAGAGPVAVYLALPPALFGPTIEALGDAGLPAGSRIAVDKPFGESLDDAAGLNELLASAIEALGEEGVFRVDHVLGMATVQNLLALRCSDPLLTASWNAEHIEQIQVRWEEDLALEGRGAFYDRAGALRDVVQSHLLQILCLLAMEPPDPAGEGLREAKLAVLRSARLSGDPAASTRRARYSAGRLDGRAVPAYAEEHGVDPRRRTETFAEVAFELDSPRWRGVGFLLRAGKAFGTRRKEVLVRFRAIGPGSPPGCLRVGIDGPRDIALRLTGTEPIDLTGPGPTSELPAYGNVLLELLEGGCTLSVGGDEAEEAWRLLAPVLAAWGEQRPPLEEYRAGSDGPESLSRRGSGRGRA